MAQRERAKPTCGPGDVTTTSGTSLRAQYRATRARLMGRERIAAAADAPETEPAPGPERWLVGLVAFNEELRRLFLRHGPTATITPGEWIRALVASHYGVTIAEIRGESSARRCARPRQVAMYLCARQAGLSTPAIAQLFGNRDPSTVVFALRAVAARAARDTALERDLSVLMAECRRGAPT